MDLKTYLTTYPKKYLIFDLDGTLARLNVDWSTYRRELWDLVATFDRELTEEVPFAHLKGIELTNKAIQKHGKKAEELLREFNGSYELSHYKNYVPNPPLVDFVKKNTLYELFLWTNNQQKTIDPFLSGEGINNSFKTCVTRDTIAFIKPDPEGFNSIYRQGSDKSDYLMIGDSVFDKEASERAGIEFFLIDYFSH